MPKNPKYNSEKDRPDPASASSRSSERPVAFDVFQGRSRHGLAPASTSDVGQTVGHTRPSSV